MAAQAALMLNHQGAARAPRSRFPTAERSLRQRMQPVVHLPVQSESGRRRQTAATAAALAESEAGSEAAEASRVRQGALRLCRSRTH